LPQTIPFAAIPIILVVAAVIPGPHTIFAQTPTNVPVEITVPSVPIPVEAEGHVLLGYELHITNFRPSDVTLNRVDVLNPDDMERPIVSYQDTNLIRCIARPGASPNLADVRVVGGGMRAVVYMWLTFNTRVIVPHSLVHRFFFAGAEADGKKGEKEMDAARIEISQDAPVVIAAPLKGKSWVALNGPSNVSIHRRALIPVDGRARIAQRFAIDWVKLGEDGKAWRGDSTKNENWYGYGAELLAVANATVVTVKQGIPENVPLSPQRAVPITLETIGGDYVILDIGNGKFATYGHLQPNSIRVVPGERVHRGQVLGALGNSGNSDAPHLHFHITNGSSELGAEGLPFVFESFEVLGATSMTDVLSRAWTPAADHMPVKRQHEMPVENLVVKF
jgi:murein DD-endopeptidase MepM/ murein hydrolase activator NlpD